MPRPRRWTAPFDVAVAIVACVVLRGVGLAGESVWLDEFFSAAYLDRPTLGAFLRDQRPENWEMVPLYYALQYGWAQWMGAGIAGVRALSIFCAAATVPMLYALGRSCFGRTAGLVAALLFAFSPFQIFHGQGLRPYALVTLLGVASAAAFLAGIQRRDRVGGLWLGAAAVLNGLLMWTHLFAPLLAVAQGIALLVMRPRWIARCLAWGLAHAVLLAPLLWWVSSIRPAPHAPVEPPPFTNLLQMVLSQDTQATFWLLREDSLAGTAQEPLIAWGGPLFLAQLLFTLIAFTSIVMACWTVLKGRRPPDGQSSGDRARAWLLLWLVVPFLALWLLAQVWIPSAMQARYALFAMPALYLVIGAAVQGVCSPRCRWALAAFVIAPMLAHAAMAPFLPMRPAYLEVAQVLQAEAKPGDRVAAPDYNVLRVLAFQAGSAATLDFEHTPDLLKDSPAPGQLLPGHGRLWVLIAGNPSQSDEADTLEAILTGHGIPWRRHTFAGLRKLYLYRVDPAALDDSAAPPPRNTP
jgi:hypothetical protein